MGGDGEAVQARGIYIYIYIYIAGLQRCCIDVTGCREGGGGYRRWLLLRCSSARGRKRGRDRDGKREHKRKREKRRRRDVKDTFQFCPIDNMKIGQYETAEPASVGLYIQPYESK